MQSIASTRVAIQLVDTYPNIRTARLVLRSVRVVLPAMLCALALLCAPGTRLAAQAAYSTGVVSTLLNTGNPNTAAGVAIDQQGNLFYADYNGDHKVYEVPLTSSGYGTPAAISTFNAPVGIVVDSSDDLFVADFGAGKVYELVYSAGSWGTPTQLGGSSFVSPTGVALDAAGNLFVADFATTGTSRVYELTLSAGSYGAAVALGTSPGFAFSHAADVALDSAGDVFVADNSASEVYEITKSSGYTTELTVGSGFNNPTSLAFDLGGNLYIVDNAPLDLQEVVAVSGSIPTSSPNVLTLGDGGFSAPNSVAIDRSGRLFVSDPGNYTLKEFVPSSVNFGAVNVGVASPPSLVLPFVFKTTETLNPPVVFTQGATGLDFTQIATTCSGTITAGNGCSVTVRFSPSAAGLRFGGVQIADSLGNVLATANLLGTGTGPQVVFPDNWTPVIVGSGFTGPTSVAIDASGDVFVADKGNVAVKEIVASGGIVTSSSTVKTVGSGFTGPSGVAVDGRGDVFVADSTGNAVDEIVAINGQASSSSTVVAVGSGFSHPAGVAVDGNGDVFVANTSDNAVDEILAINGQVSSSSVVVAIGSGFSGPSAVAVDANGDVFVADQANNAVKEIVAVDGQASSSSTVKTVGSGFSGPSAVSVDASGDVFVADQGSSAIKEIVAAGGQVSSSSSVLTLGLADSPAGVAVDASGNVFVADVVFNAVAEIPLATPPSLAFPTITQPGTSDTIDDPYSTLIANNGNATLTFNLPTSGDNPGLSTSNFAWDDPTSTCTQTTTSSSTAFTLAGGASCILAIDFTPTAIGTLTDNLSVTDDALNAAAATQQIPLSGVAATSPTITSPTNGSTLTGTSTTFTWTVGSGVETGYYLHIGTSPGAANLVNIGPLSGTSATVTLPTTGATIYAQLQTIFSGGSTMLSSTYTYTEATAGVITSPTPGTALTGASTTFTWTAASSGATGYYLHIGTSLGTGNLVNIGVGTSTSATVTLPTNGATIYVQLETHFGSTVIENNNTYTEATAGVITSPTPGTALTGASTTFTWTAGSSGVTGYYLHIGTSLGTGNLVNIGVGTSTSATVTLPTNGATIYVQLETHFGSNVVENNNTYTEVAQSGGVITSPTPGTALTGASTTFTWTAASSGVTGYYLHIGTSLGTGNLVNIGVGTSTSATVTLPTNGATIYVQLETHFGSTVIENNNTYTEAAQSGGVITSPTPGTALTGASTTFTWTAGTAGVTGYYLHIGTSPGTGDLVNMGVGTNTSATVTLPTNGATIYVQLETHFGSTIVENNNTYTEFTQ